MASNLINPTSAELQNVALACSKLWELDSNRLTPGKDYQINVQHGKSLYQKGDVAPENLFTYVNENIFEKKTFRTFYDLLDNYERAAGVEETVTPEEVRENRDFINAIMATKPMQYVHKWLTKANKVRSEESSMKKLLNDLWFGLYKRECQNDSSGFEHVFVGEIRDGKVIGMHNWIQLFIEEKRKKFDYLGYIKPKQRGQSIMKPHDHEQLITIQFAWEKEVKQVSTTFIGVSPEFEVALYTLCFMSGQEELEVVLGPYRCLIKCFTIGRGDRKRIGTCYPEALPLTPDMAAAKIQAQFRGNKCREATGKRFPGTATVPRSANAWQKPNTQVPLPNHTNTNIGTAWQKGNPPAPPSTCNAWQKSNASAPQPASPAVQPQGGPWQQPRAWK